MRKLRKVLFSTPALFLYICVICFAAQQTIVSTDTLNEAWTKETANNLEKADKTGTSPIVTTDSITAEQFIAPFVDGEAVFGWTDTNTTYTPAAGFYGITFISGVLNQIINGVASPIGSGGTDVTTQAADPTAGDSTGFYLSTGTTKFWYRDSTLGNYDFGTYTFTPDAIIPVVSGVTIDGTAVVITYDVAVTQGTGYTDADLNIDGATMGNDVALTYVSGDTTTAHTYTSATAAIESEVINLDFLGRVDGLESSTGDDLVAFTDQAIVNNTVDSIVYVIDQNFETATTGYDNGETWGETLDGGTIEAASTVSPLLGTQSCRMAASTGTSQRIQTTLSPAIGESYIHFRRRINTTPTVGHDIFTCLDSGVGVLFRVNVDSVLLPRIYMVGGSEQSGTTLVEDTEYHFWLKYVPGTGSNALIEVYIGETTTRPASPSMSISTGSVTTDITYVRLQNGASANVDVDQVLISETEFTTVP